MTQVIADAFARPGGKVSAQQLSERCTELGYPIPRSTIANLERGRKETISVQEVLVLARALEVPPLQLVFPVGRERTLVVLPGEVTSTWLAAERFTGEGPFPVALPGGDWGANTPRMRAWKSGAPAVPSAPQTAGAEANRPRLGSRSPTRER